MDFVLKKKKHNIPLQNACNHFVVEAFPKHQLTKSSTKFCLFVRERELLYTIFHPPNIKTKPPIGLLPIHPKQPSTRLIHDLWNNFQNQISSKKYPQDGTLFHGFYIEWTRDTLVYNNAPSLSHSNFVGLDPTLELKHTP